MGLPAVMLIASFLNPRRHVGPGPRNGAQASKDQPDEGGGQ